MHVYIYINIRIMYYIYIKIHNIDLQNVYLLNKCLYIHMVNIYIYIYIANLLIAMWYVHTALQKMAQAESSSAGDGSGWVDP